MEEVEVALNCGNRLKILDQGFNAILNTQYAILQKI